MRYKAREMEFLDQPKKVVLCDDRAASALSSISNCLLLTNGFSVDSHDANEVQESYLKRCISRRVLDLFKSLVPPTHENQRILQTYFDITKKISTGIEVIPVAGSAKEFEPSREYEFFRTLGIPLLHASAFNEQVLSNLQEQLEHGQVGILYLNKQFNTICKHNGTIYMLVEDERLHLSNSTSSWKTIVNEKELFMANDFSCITARIDKKMYKCSRCCMEFTTNISYERHVEVHLPASKANLIDSWNESTLAKYWDDFSDEEAYNILSCGHEIVEKSHGSSVESIIKKWITSPEFGVTPPEVNAAVRKLKHLMGSKSKKSSSDVLLSMLKVASEGTFMSTNLLKGKFLFVEADKSENTMRSMLAYFSLKIEESLAEKWYAHKTAEARAARTEILTEEQKQSQVIESTKDGVSAQHPVHRDVASVASEISTSSSQTDDEIHKVSDNVEVSKDDENRKLLPEDLSHMPQLVNEEYFPVFVARKTLVRIFTLFSQVKVSTLTRVGRKIAKRLLKYILEVHKGGHCWNGEWNILDIRVKGDGSTFLINKTLISASKDGIANDLQKFIALLNPYYKIEGISGPLYFDEFHSDAMAVPEVGSEKFVLFQKFLADHMAFMPPLARSNLIESMFKWCDDMRKEKGDYGYEPLRNIDCRGWTRIRSSMVYDEVFFHHGCVTKPYHDNYWDLLRFLRNFSNHALQYTKINGVQVVEDIAVLDLMVAYDLGSFITKLLLHLLYVFEKPNRLVSIWIAYKTSDDENEENDEEN